ncbi:GapS4b family protein [Aeromonas caviae]|uniref:GapS4b family protein n=1 Tax=Aeromonas caviae TaxID=648 RepID=UPI0005A74C00|nr:hypothetical protein [Aeromonas caviae]MBS4634844.1 hypothetical protein [Aeromonas caviae]WQD87808.1 hypothetical protein U0022_13750 [Aeromonas caviae]SQH60281.1 Uncharacterised protein [Aeromonas caviae]
MSDAFFIPTGDYLRQFIGNSMIKAPDIQAILKSRGTFSSSTDKVVLGPLLVKTGISPEEFELLKEAIQSKEDNPKIRTRNLKWNSDETLLNALPFDFDFSNLINDPFGVISIDNVPSFSAAGDGKDPNHIIAEVTLKRTDKTKNFGDDVSFHNGSIELKLTNDNVDLRLTMKHTSKETANVLNKISTRVHKHLSEHNYIIDQPLQQILFGDFTNEARIGFLLELARTNEMYLYYKDMKKVTFSPDDDLKDSRPQEMEWFEEKVKNLMFKGQGLDTSLFFIKEELKSHIKLYSVTSSYELNDDEHQGTCTVTICFPEQEENSELMMEVDNINIQRKMPAEQKSKIKLDILKFLESHKLKLHEKYKG